MRIRIIRALLIAPLILLSLAFPTGASSASPFKDVLEDPLYSRYISSLNAGHFVVGRMDGAGNPTGLYLPNDPLNRAEFTKITALLRLAEKFGIEQGWESFSLYRMQVAVKELLYPFYRCHNTDIPDCSKKEGAGIKNICNVCLGIGGVPFSDVAEKERDCETKGLCSPWYTEYVYYAVRKGYISGYGTSAPRSFKPGDKIIRLHALKMLLAENGSADPLTDSRYLKLLSRAVSRNSNSPYCLKGAEEEIKKLTDAAEPEAERLLRYALLADRLQFFGNECQGFGNAKNPEARAAFLMAPIKRKEVPRYAAISAFYPPLTADPSLDPTLNTAEENRGTAWSLTYGEGDPSLPEPEDGEKEPDGGKDPPETEEPAKTQPKTETPEKDEDDDGDETVYPSPYSSVNIKSPMRVCLSFNEGCVTLPVGKVAEEVNAGLSGPLSDLKYYATIRVDGVTYDVPCDVWKSDLCRIAGWKPETSQKTSPPVPAKTEAPLPKIPLTPEEISRVLETAVAEITRNTAARAIAHSGERGMWVVTPEKGITQITQEMNEFYGTCYTPEQIAKINGLADIKNLKPGTVIRIGTPDGWQPPLEPDTINEAYWNNLTVEQKKILHYHRNFYQPVSDLPKTNKNFSWRSDWSEKGERPAHNIGTSGNIDYRGLNKFKGIQVIYDKNGNLVKTFENMGTYDFVSPNVSIMEHLNVDVKPWIEWGNSIHDTTTKEERINGMKKTIDGRIGLYSMGYIKRINIFNP